MCVIVKYFLPLLHCSRICSYIQKAFAKINHAILFNPFTADPVKALHFAILV